MERYFVNLFCLPDPNSLYERIHSLAFDDYIIAGKPHAYEVMWEHREPISTLIPEIPSNRISAFLETL